MPLISCKNVKFKYDDKTIINNITFNINKGDYICIVGENGSGKSTLINLISGMLKPTEGTIEFSDEITKKEIGYLPQQTDIQKDFPASVYEVVISGCTNKLKLNPFYGRNEKQIANYNMKLLEITDLKRKSFHSLSGGQKQRVLLARALCATESTLFLDEPVSGLDPLVTEAFYKITNHLNNDHNTTIVMVSHDIASALKYSSHILHIEEDSYFFGETNEYIKTESYKKISGGIFNV